MSRTGYAVDPRQYGYDYTNQAWVEDGVYVKCGHPEDMDCARFCFAKRHAGEPVHPGVSLH